MPIDFLQQNIILVALAIISGTMFLWPFLRRSGAKEISVGDATLMINRQNAVVLDVRAPAEFAAGHLADAINVPVDKIADRASELEKYKGRPVIVTCQTGVRSSGACSALRKLGFDQLFNLAGGIGAWQQAGMPVRKGSK